MRNMILAIASLFFFYSCTSTIDVELSDSNISEKLFLSENSASKESIISEVILEQGETLQLYALYGRRDYKNIAVQWTLKGNIGVLSVMSGGTYSEFIGGTIGYGEISIGYNGVIRTYAITVKAKSDTAPVTIDIVASDAQRDVEAVISLNYTDIDGDEASSCTISNLSNLTETTACACSSGACTVGVTAMDYAGAVSFDFLVSANSVNSNTSTVSFTVNGIGGNLSDDWVKIPANAGGLGLAEFYVMRYEAKAWRDDNVDTIIDTGEVDTDGTVADVNLFHAVSVPEGSPWRYISASVAASKCEALGANYHLISNDEWMAIARDVETVDANWTGGSVGSGCLIKGNSTDTTCGYDAGGSVDYGTSRNIRAKHYLSNGDEIYDLAGNIFEWMDWDKVTPGIQYNSFSCTGNWTEIINIGSACTYLNNDDYNTINGTYSSNDGVGQIYINNGSGRPALRGGSYLYDFETGIFTMYLGLVSLNHTDADIGFRCAYYPN